MPSTCYHSKIDLWIGAMVGLSVVVTLGAAAWLIATQPGAWLIGVIIVVSGAIVPVWLMRTTRYELSDDLLHVRSGPFAWKVPLHEIRKVARSRNILSSPAFSLDRLRIDYGNGKFILISPEDREAFLRDLERRRAAAISRSASKPHPLSG